MRPVLTLALIALLSPPAASASEGVGGSPRVLLVDLDDVGFDLLQATSTPTLDWITTHGRSFTTFTTAPICSPTRAMMMTGAYPSHPDLLLGTLVRPQVTFSMPLAPLETLPSIVAGAGFSTAKVGKWHLCAENERTHPNDCGWGDYAGVLGNLGGGAVDYLNYPKVVNGVQTSVSGRYLTSEETDDAIEFVRAGVDLVSISYHAPHKPFHEPPAHLHSITPLSTDLDRARAMLQACDRELGRLLREALVRDYLVLVASDNGTSQTLGGGKNTVLDRGVVVPFFAIGPGVLPGIDGTRIGAQDIYATIAEIFGVPAGPPFRGPHSRSFLPALRGLGVEHRWTYSEKFRTLGVDPRTTGAEWLRMVRGERFKLVREQNGAGESMFDLGVDPNETTDLLQLGSLPPAASAALDRFRLVMDRL